MSLKIIILSLLLAELATKCFVKGLQCYVCDNCNEYEDFRELHICGEIPIETLMRPTTTSMSLVTKLPTKKPPAEAATKPSVKPSVDDYSYEDSGENYSQASSQNSIAMKTTTKTSSTRSTTPKTVSVTENSSSSSDKSTTQSTRTTQPVMTSSQNERTKLYSPENKKTTKSIAISTTTTKLKPLTPDYDDYLEYEDAMKREERSETSLIKINEPVCYMIKYYANNTVFTNRGCTTFINANKYLTCQSLYNGSPMESCRICFANGCNKFLSDDGEEDNHGIYVDAAAAPKLLGIFMLTLWVLFTREII